MLTINNDTFYAAFDLHLDESGPTVIEIPQGINARGSALDMWQRPIADMAKPRQIPIHATWRESTEGHQGIHRPEQSLKRGDRCATALCKD